MNPKINWQAVISSLVILVIAGTLVGFIPAWHALKIKPVDALRTEV